MKRIIKRKMMVGENLLKIELMRPPNIDKGVPPLSAKVFLAK